LITHIAAETGVPATQVETVMDAVFNSIIDRLREGEKVTIAGFGRFEMRQRQTKAYTNPKTKVSTQLAPGQIPGFKASGIMKKKIAGE
jgi:DNA-binding protein HU-beta